MKLPHLKSGAPTLTCATELQAAFDHYNQHLFDGQLPPCLMTLQRTGTAFGYFSPQRFLSAKNGAATDEIAINPAYVANYPPIEVMQTVVHEMCHMWQDHFGKPSKRSYHNREWANKMESIGLMPSSTGLPGGARTGEKMADYPISGGRFVEATRSLCVDGPFLTWYDRFSAPGRSKPTPAQRPMAMYETGIALVVEDDVEEDEEDLHTSNGSTGIEIGLPAWLTSAPTDSDANLAASLAIRDGQSGQKHKYSCLPCSVNVWGKKGLSLVCGECGERFSAVGQEMEP